MRKALLLILLLLVAGGSVVRAQESENPLQEMLFVEQDQQFDAYRRAEDNRLQNSLRMPNVQGWSRDRAVTFIQSLDYRLQPVIKNAPSEGPPGKVVVQRPLPGQSLEDAQVVLFVSTELLDFEKRRAVISQSPGKVPSSAAGGGLVGGLLFLCAQLVLLAAWVGVSAKVEQRLEVERPNDLAIFSGRPKRKSELESSPPNSDPLKLS